MKLLEEDNRLVLKRKYEHILAVCGKGTILLGIWYIFKMLLYMLLVSSARQAIRERAVQFNIPEELYIALAVFLFLIFLLIRGHVGVTAMREARGKKVRITFLILVAVLAVFSFYSSVSTFDHRASYFDEFDLIAAFALELIAAWINLEILIYSAKLRRLSKELAAEKGE